MKFSHLSPKYYVIISTDLRPSQASREGPALDLLVLLGLCSSLLSYELEEEPVTPFYNICWVLGTLEFPALKLLLGLPSQGGQASGTHTLNT